MHHTLGRVSALLRGVGFINLNVFIQRTHEPMCFRRNSSSLIYIKLILLNVGISTARLEELGAC